MNIYSIDLEQADVALGAKWLEKLEELAMNLTETSLKWTKGGKEILNKGMKVRPPTPQRSELTSNEKGHHERTKGYSHKFSHWSYTRRTRTTTRPATTQT